MGYETGYAGWNTSRLPFPQYTHGSQCLVEPGLLVAKSLKDYMEAGRKTRQLAWLHMVESVRQNED